MLTIVNGEKSEGVFKCGKIWNGYGTKIEPRGFKYIGDFKNGKYDGLGTYIVSYGKYIGEWKNGKLSGQGVLLNKDGKVSSIGEWNGFTQEEGIIISKSGRLSRRESNAFRRMEGAFRDQGIVIPNSERMHRRNP
jgi:hypothetical protein